VSIPYICFVLVSDMLHYRDKKRVAEQSVYNAEKTKREAEHKRESAMASRVRSLY